MAVNVERDFPNVDGYYIDRYEEAGTWFIAASGELVVYLGDSDEPEAVMAEYGRGKFIRAFKDPLPSREPQPNEKGRLPGEDESGEFEDEEVTESDNPDL